jgi:hypothetical protein
MGHQDLLFAVLKLAKGIETLGEKFPALRRGPPPEEVRRKERKPPGLLGGNSIRNS